jgi:hypothetical protein
VKRILLFLGLLAGLLAVPPRVAGQTFDHSAWDRILKKHVREDGRVDYAALQADPAELNAYVAQVAARSPVSHPRDFPTRASRLAYWINAYNALTIKGVADNWPTKSVRDLGFLFGFFRKKQFVVGGEKYSLDDIEHERLRKELVEPRIHFALVCASLGCPRLQREAYTPENAERLLDEAARTFLNEPRNLKVEPGRNRVTLAKIFDWFGGDFVAYARQHNLSGTGHPIVDYIRQYATEENRRALDALKKPSVSYFGYDWGINAVEPARGN